MAMDTAKKNLSSEIMGQVLKFPETAFGWVMDRLAKIDFFDETKAHLQKESPWYQLGPIYYLCWVIVLITGCVLIAVYLPTTAQAYNSVALLSENIWGSILRGAHKYAGDAMIIAATCRVYRMWFNAEYKNKGEFTFILSILLLLAAMYSGLSGYLLIWNQRAFWATKVFATFPTFLDITPKYWYWPWEGNILVNQNTWLIPNIVGSITKVIGDVTHQGMSTSQILMGGSSIGQATLTRFFSLHFTISILLLIVTELYFYKNRLKRINLPKSGVFAIIAIVVATAIIFPAESGSRANPEVTPLPILSDWYFLALYQMLKYMDPYWATIWTLGIPVSVIAMMFMDLGPEKDMAKRPFFTTAAIMGFILFVIFSMLIIANQANIDRDPPYWYASMVIFFAVGQFWHFALYKQKIPMLAWVVFNIAFSYFYLWFWHVQAGDWLMLWFNTTFIADFVVPQQYNEFMINGVFNWTNLYWNFIWFVFSTIQALVAGLLIFSTKPSEEVPMGGTLQEAKN